MYAPECRYHKGRPATTQCAACGAPVCHDCAQPTPSGRLLCRACCVRLGLPQKRGGEVSTLAWITIVACTMNFAVLAGLSLGQFMQSVQFYYLTVPVIIACAPMLIFCCFLLLRQKWARWAIMIHSVFLIVLSGLIVGCIIFTTIASWNDRCMALLMPILLFILLLFASPSSLVLPILFLRVLTLPAVRLEFGYLPKEKRVTV